MQLTVESYGITDIGLSRSNNEDIWAEMPDLQFYALADGMGGHQAGEVAAKETVLHVCDLVDAFFTQSAKPTLVQIATSLRNAIIEANSWVRALAQQHPELAGMGTTFCCMLLYEKTLVYAHVGDSRIYRFRKHLEKLTADHSLRQELLAKGDLDAETAAAFPFKNVITRAIGTASIVEPEIATDAAESGDIYFLCSDGLTDFVSDSAIEELLSQKLSLKETALELVEKAKSAGGSDNITLVLIKIIEAS